VASAAPEGLEASQGLAVREGVAASSAVVDTPGAMDEVVLQVTLVQTAMMA
jgi:hypothetical protein